MALSVGTKRRIRTIVLVVGMGVAAVLVYQNWYRIAPLLGQTAERAYEAADDLVDAEHGR